MTIFTKHKNFCLCFLQYPWNEKSGKDFEKSLKASSQSQYCVGNPRVSALTLFYTGVSDPLFLYDN